MSQCFCIIKLAGFGGKGSILGELPRHLMERGSWHVVTDPGVMEACPDCLEFHDALILASQLGAACWFIEVLELPLFCERSRQAASTALEVDLIGETIVELVAGLGGNTQDQGIASSPLVGETYLTRYEFSLWGRNRFDQSRIFLRAKKKIDSFQECFDSVDGHVVPIVYDATWGIIKDWLESLKDEIDRTAPYLAFC
jgi:hypothetical protein